MALRKIWSIFFLVFVIAANATALPLETEVANTNTIEGKGSNYRLPDDTKPIHYDIKLIPYIVEDNFTFDGEVTVRFEVLKPTKDVALHADTLTIDEAGTKLLTNDTTLLPEKHSYNNDTDILRIHFKDLLEPATYSLSLKFAGILSDDLLGFYRTSYRDKDKNEVWLATTQFQATAARRAFPCWDEPALKATFDVSIKHYANYTALSNMPIKEQSEIDLADEKMWTHFHTTPLMSTYLVAFIVAPGYANVSNADNTINVWCREELIPTAGFIHEVAQKAAVELERYTNSSVRVPKMDHVAVPAHAAGAMENWGMITYPESSFSYSENESVSGFEKFSIATVVAHELAHQWFGNVVSPTWWSHIWLNEGFASYFESYILDKIFDNWRVVDYFIVESMQESLSLDVIVHITSIDEEVTTKKEIGTMFSLATYSKAPSILRMLSHILSEDVFRTGLIAYLDEHEYNSASPDCLWTALQNALDESDVPHNDFNVKEVMDSWIKQERYPLVTVIRDYSTGETKVMQEDFGMVEGHAHYHHSDEYREPDEPNKWWIPVNYATERNSDFANTLPTHWLKPQDNLTIDGIDTDGWVIFNKQETGYYRVNYDPTNWKRIADCLRSDNFTKIHRLNRAQIMDDAVELLAAKRMNASLFVELTGYLAQETDFIPWFPIFNFLNTVNDFFMLPEASSIKTTMSNMMDNLVREVGFEERPGESVLTTMKRIEALQWACKFGNTECIKAANTKLIEHLENPDKKMPARFGRWTCCMGLREANESVWEKFRDVYLQKRDHWLLRYLGCTSNPILMEKYLNMSLTNDTSLSISEQAELLTFASSEMSHDIEPTIDFVVEHFDEIVARFHGVISPGNLMWRISHLSTTERQIEKLKKFLETRDADKLLSAGSLESHQEILQKVSLLVREWSAFL